MEPRPPRESLGELLTVEPLGGGAFRAELESFFGDAVAEDLLARAVAVAQAGRAAELVASHMSLVALPPPGNAVRFERQDLEGDRCFVRALHEDRGLADVLVRFASAQDGGLAYQGLPLPTGLPEPDALPSEHETAAEEGWAPYADGPVESRRIGPWRVEVGEREPAVWMGWLRPRLPLPQSGSAAALAFASAYRSHWAVERRLGDAFAAASITMTDHALWVHDPRPWDDWWLVRTRTEIASRGRCLSHRELFARDGALLATASAELRVRL